MPGGAGPAGELLFDKNAPKRDRSPAGTKQSTRGVVHRRLQPEPSHAKTFCSFGEIPGHRLAKARILGLIAIASGPTVISRCDKEVVMSNMLRKSLIPAELMVASSLLLAPSFTLTGYGQNNPANQPAPRQVNRQPLRRRPVSHGSVRHSARLRPYAGDRPENAGCKTRQR